MGLSQEGAKAGLLSAPQGSTWSASGIWAKDQDLLRDPSVDPSLTKLLPFSAPHFGPVLGYKQGSNKAEQPPQRTWGPWRGGGWLTCSDL